MRALLLVPLVACSSPGVHEPVSCSDDWNQPEQVILGTTIPAFDPDTCDGACEEVLSDAELEATCVRADTGESCTGVRTYDGIRGCCTVEGNDIIFAECQ